MGDCLTIPAANDFLSKDENRISGRIARSLAINSPWINLLETSTFKSGVSDIQRSIRQEAIAPVLSQVTPNWGAFACSKTPTQIESGSTEFQYTPLSHLEFGPKLCVTQAFSSFRNAIRQMEMSITDHVQTLWNSWIRYQLYINSATKVTVATGHSLAGLIATGYATPFKLGVTPNAGLSFTFLKAMANYMTHSLLAGDEFKFGSGGMKYYRFISDQTTVDTMRNEANVRADQRFIAAGSFKSGKEALETFSWEGPYQGVGFGVDQSIPRADSFDATTGLPHFVEPFITVTTSKGTMRAPNPSWESAPYQVSYLIAKNSFIREIPEEYLGEGMTRFDRQFWGGKIVWHNQRDNDCNVKGDTGFHYYDLAAAMRPERPEFVIPIIHARCIEDLGLCPCTPQGYYSNSF